MMVWYDYSRKRARQKKRSRKRVQTQQRTGNNEWKIGNRYGSNKNRNKGKVEENSERKDR